MIKVLWNLTSSDFTFEIHENVCESCPCLSLFFCKRTFEVKSFCNCGYTRSLYSLSFSKFLNLCMCEILDFNDNFVVDFEMLNDHGWLCMLEEKVTCY